jgi:CDP-diglyceride synthetase
MHPWLMLQLLMLLTLANGTPVLVKKLIGDFLAAPLDGGRNFLDGKPLLGRSKTIRGLVLSILITMGFAPILGLPWYIGGVVGTTAMLGDLVSSFLKRRIGLPPSAMMLGLDQIPESLLPLLACAALLELGLCDIVLGTAIFFAGGLVLSRLLFRLNIRERPF